MTGFIFCNRFGSVPNPQTVNHTIKRIANNYNADEVVRAKKEHRDPIILPNFSCHHLRHACRFISGIDTRATMDIDSTIKALSLNEEAAVRIVNEITRIHIEDGTGFEIVRLHPIRSK